MNTMNRSGNNGEAWKNVRNMIYPVMVGDSNTGSLGSSVVCGKYLDMTVIYIIREMDERGKVKSVKVTWDMLEYFGISLKELAETACRNLGNDGYSFIRIEDCIMDLRTEGENTCRSEEELLPGRLYVFTNRSRCLGASGLLYDEMIRNVLGEKKCYVLPSSIHEILFLPDDDGIDAQSLCAIVREINSTNVSPREKLSDHVYYYDGRSGGLSICA